MKTVNTNKISAIFLGVVLLSSVLSTAAYAGGLPITDLSIKKTSNQATAAPGDLWEFSVAVTNNSQEPAEFAEIVDKLDSNLEFDSASPDICSLAPSINTLFCFLPTLSTGEEFVVDITTRVKSTTPLGIEIPNIASVFGDSSASTPDDEDDIFLMIDAPQICTCDKITIKPLLTKSGEWRIKGLALQTAESVDISIFMPWEVSITCKGNSGMCAASYDLIGFDLDGSLDPKNKWTHGIGLLGPKKEGVDAKGNPVNTVGDPPKQKHFRVANNVNEKEWIKFQDGPGTIDCTGECDGTTMVRKTVKTKYITQIINEPSGKGLLEFQGSIAIDIFLPDPNECPNKNTKKTWTVILQIDTTGLKKDAGTNTRINIIDTDASDFDGDGSTNEQEEKAGTDPFNDNDPPKPP